MPFTVSAQIDGTTETEAKERARIAQIASDSLLVSRTPGSSASLSVADAEPQRIAQTFTPGRSLRVILDGSASECTVRAGSASVQFAVTRVAVKEGRKTISDLITARQKGV